MGPAATVGLAIHMRDLLMLIRETIWEWITNPVAVGLYIVLATLVIMQLLM